VGESGSVPMRVELIIRFGYGNVVPWVTRLDDGGLRAIAGPDMLVLHTPVALRGEKLKTVGEFRIGAGDTVPFSLVHAPAHLPPIKPSIPQAALASTESF